MTTLLREPTRPRGRDDLELVRASREGTFWQAPDGLVVRLASAEAGHVPDAEAGATHRILLELACREAGGR